MLPTPQESLGSWKAIGRSVIACIKSFCHGCSKPQRGFFVLRNLETKAGATIPLHTQLHPADQAGPTIAPTSVKQNFPALDAPSHYSHRGLPPRGFSNWVLPQLQDPFTLRGELGTLSPSPPAKGPTWASPTTGASSAPSASNQHCEVHSSSAEILRDFRKGDIWTVQSPGTVSNW